MPVSTVKAPDGRILQVNHPDGASEESIFSYASSQYKADPTIGYFEEESPDLTGRVAEFAKGVPRGFANSFLTSAEGIAQLADTATDFVGLDDLIDSGEENELIRLARAGREKVDESLGADPAYRDLWTTKFGDAMGSLASFFTPAAGAKLVGLTGKVAKHIPAAGFATGVGAGEQSQRIEMAREQGIDVSEGREDASIVAGSLIGLSELAPVGFILKGLTKADMQKPFFKSIVPRLKQALASGSVEAVQEVSAGIAQDLTEKGLYNPNLPIGQSAWDEITLGGAAGFTADLLLNAMAGRRLNAITQQEKDREATIRRDEAEWLKQQAKEFQGEPINPNAKLPRLPAPNIEPVQPTDPNDPVSVARAAAQTVELQMGDTFPLNQTFAPVETGDGKWMVEDTTGKQYGNEYDTANEAAILAGEMGEIVIDRTLKEKADLAIDQTGEQYSNPQRLRLRQVARRLFHPSENKYTPQQINLAANTTVENDYTHEGMSAAEAIDAGVKIKDMTAAQQINVRRLKNDMPETNQFSVAEAKAVLGKNFGKILNPQTGNAIPDVKIADIRNVLQEKNITSDVNSPEVSEIAEIVTGRKPTGKTKVSNLSAADKMMVLNKLRQMPKFDGPTKLPQYGLRPYSTGQYHAAKQNMLEQVRDPAYDGRDVVPSTQVTKDLKPEVRDRLVDDLNKDGGLQSQIAQDKAAASTARANRTEYQAQQDQQYKDLTKVIRKAFSRFGLRNVGVRMTDFIRQTKLDAEGNVVEGDVLADRGTEGGYKKNINTIFVALEGIKANPRYMESLGKPEKERNKILDELASETVTHEVVHAMRQADLLTQKELEMLEDLARTTKRDGISYTEWADKVYRDNPNASVRMEEAIAELIRDGVAGNVKVAPKTRNLLQRIMTFLRGVLQIKETGGYRSFDDLIEGLTSGEVGAREEGVVRTLHRTEKLAADAGKTPDRWELPPKTVGVETSKKKIPTYGKGQRQPDFLESRGNGKPVTANEMNLIKGYEEALFGGTYGHAAYNRAAENSPDRQMIDTVRGSYNKLRTKFGFPVIEDWSVLPDFIQYIDQDIFVGDLDFVESRRLVDSIPNGQQMQEAAGLDDVAFSRRLERAREQGFDTSTVYYHGSMSRHIASFHSTRGEGIAGFFTTDANFASGFAEGMHAYAEERGGTMYPVFLRVDNTFDATDPSDQDALESYILKNYSKPEQAGYRNRYLRTLERLKEGAFDYVELERLSYLIQQTGYDSYHDFEYTNHDPTGIAVFDSGNIKGIFAKFDPKNELGTRPIGPPSAYPELYYGTDIMYSRRELIKKRYNDRIDKIYAGEKGQGWLRILDRADMLEMMEYGDMPLYVSEDKITETIGTHRLSANDWKRLPDWIENPMAVFDSNTVRGRLVMIAPEPVNGSPVVIALQPDAGGKQTNVHVLNSAYDTPQQPPDLYGWVRGKLLRYANTAMIRTRGGDWLNWPHKLNIHEGRNASNRVLTQKDLVKYHDEDMGFVDKSPVVTVTANPGRARGYGFPDTVGLDELFAFNREVMDVVTDKAGKIPLLTRLKIPHKVRESIGSYEGIEPGIHISLPDGNLHQANLVANIVGDALLQDAAVTIQPAKKGKSIGAALMKTDGSAFTQKEVESIALAVNPENDPFGMNFSLLNDEALVFIDGRQYDDSVTYDAKTMYPEFHDGLVARLPEGISVKTKMFRQNGEYYDHRQYHEAARSNGVRAGITLTPPVLRAADSTLYKPIWEKYLEAVNRFGFTPDNTARPRPDEDTLFSRRDTGLKQPAVRPSTGLSGRGRAAQPITLGARGRVEGASTFEGVHYGKDRVEVLEGDRNGTGIKGAEAIRLMNSTDPRIKRRVYFYIPNTVGNLQHPEAGLGHHIHTQMFDNILEANGPAAAVIKQQVESLGARDFANNFESALVDAGYDGYAVENTGVMVVLDHDVPVNYLGTRSDIREKGINYREILQKDHPPEQVAEIVAANKLIADENPQHIPEFSPNASPDAQYVAANPAVGRKSDTSFMRREPLMTAEEKAAIDSVVQPRPDKPRPMDTYQLAVGAVDTPSGLKYLMTKAKQESLNRYARLEHLNWTTDLRNNLADTSSIAAALHADRGLGIVAAAIKHGQPVYENGMVHVRDASEGGGKSLIEIMSPLYSETHGNLTDAAKAYAISQRSYRLEDGVETPVTPEYRRRIERMVDRYNDDNGNIIRRWYDEWQEYNNSVITMMQKAGVLTDETADLWRDYSDYYPFYRVAEGGGKLMELGQKVFGGMTSSVSIRRMKGGKTPINMDMMEAISMNLSAAVQMSMKNIAQQRIVRDMVRLGLAEDVGRAAHHPTAPVVDFKVNGEERHFAIFDPLIYESMLPLDGTELVATIRNTFGLPATLLREMITRSPGFMAVNLLRDSLSSYATSGASLTPIISTTKGLFDGITRLEKMGVVGGYDYSNDPHDIKKYWNHELRRRGMDEDGHAHGLNLFVRMWDALGRGTTASDAATRNAVFDDVYAKTGNLAEASFQAMEVINFGRRGRHPLARIIGAVVPFLNARFQGLDVFTRAYTGRYTANKEKNRSQIIMSAMSRGALLTSMTALYYMLVSDDEQYKQANDYLKDNNWLIPTPWGVPVTLPIPFEVGLIFKTMPETILASTIGEKTGKEVKETLKRGVGSTLEVSPYSIQFAGPALEAAVNYNSFTGREIVPKYLLNVEPAAQTKPYTTEIAKFIGKHTNTSPLKWDHALTGYMGTMGIHVWDVVDAALKTKTVQGDYVAAMPSRQWYDYPIIKRAFGNKNDSGLLADAYSLFHDIDKAVNTLNLMKNNQRGDEYVAYLSHRQNMLAMKGIKNNIEKQLKAIRDHKRAVHNSDMSPAMKRHEIDALDAQMNMMLKTVIPRLKETADQPFFDSMYK